MMKDASSEMSFVSIFGARGAIPGMAMGGVTLSGGLPGTLQGALPAGPKRNPGSLAATG